jgi:ribosomal 50S subunit-recycling heat shock protein
VLVNGREGRAAKDIRTGDRVAVSYATRTIEVEVLETPERSGRLSPEALYRIVADRRTKQAGTEL